MAQMDEVRALATELPDVVEKPHFGRPAFRVRDKLFLSVHPDEDVPFAIAHVSRDDTSAEVTASPDVVEEVWRTHGGRSIFVGLRIDLTNASAEQIRDLIERAWRNRAPKRLVATFDAT